MLRTDRKSTSSGIWLWSIYIGFVIYGSLVPLDFHFLPLNQAIDRFLAIELLNVGAEGRADWVSNGVLYIPVAFLTVNMLAGQKPASLSAWHLIGSLLFSFALAVSVEFAQLYFPQRTVSLNDLIAEFLGSIVGAGIAFLWVGRFRSLLAALGGVSLDRLLTYLLEFYAFLYIAFSIFPFDFILSFEEFEWKLYSGSWGWLLASDFASSSIVRLFAKLTAEVLAVIPLGFLWARLRPEREPGIELRSIRIGLGLGLSIEIIQFFLFSGISQGLSVLTRVLGMYIGAVAWRRKARIDVDRLSGWIRRHIHLVACAYLFGLVLACGWLDHRWTNLETAIRVFSETRFLPFYYHYYTTEQAALLSLAAVALMYAPVGVLAWCSRKTSATWAFLVAALLAFGIEASKLFLEGLHPDPSNMLIAGLSAWSASRLAEVFSATREEDDAAGLVAPLGMGETLQGSRREASVLSSDAPGDSRPVVSVGIAAMVGCLLLAFWGASTFPAFAIPLGLLLAGHTVLLWYRPHLLVAVVPAAAALLDLAPWSSRFFFDEFDMLLLITVILGYSRTRRRSESLRADKLLVTAIGLLALSFLVSTLIGLFPWPAIDANILAHYYSPLNALRLAKGALWAFLLYGLFGRFLSAGHNVARLFALGMAGGVTGTVLVIFWERFVFPGLLNFSDTYRVTGPFSQMHTGGADIETYLTLGAPFLVMLLIDKRPVWARILGVLALFGATYGVMVTFSRVGYAGYGVALALALVATTATASGHPLKRGTLAMVLLLAVLGIATPIYFSQFAQERMTLVGADLEARRDHWRDALKMRDPGWVTTVFGMGIGRYPATHFWRSDETKAGPYWLGSDADNTFLRLGAGSPLYVEQFVSVQPGTDYTVEMKGRSAKRDSQVTVSICEKWLLTSANCSSASYSFNGDGNWQTLKIRIPSGDVGQEPWYARRPTKFSITNTSRMATVDIDDIRLTSDVGQDLVANGDFSKKLDNWFFSVDNDLPWHIWSLPLQILFDQGWLGVIAFGLFVMPGLWRSGQQAWRGNIVAGVLLASGAGFLVIGTLDSLVDSPRLLLLFLLVIWMCWRCARLSLPTRD